MSSEKPKLQAELQKRIESGDASLRVERSRLTEQLLRHIVNGDESDSAQRVLDLSKSPSRWSRFCEVADKTLSAMSLTHCIEWDETSQRFILYESLRESMIELSVKYRDEGDAWNWANSTVDVVPKSSFELEEINLASDKGWVLIAILLWSRERSL